MTESVVKTKAMAFVQKNSFRLKINGKTIEQISYFQYLEYITYENNNGIDSKIVKFNVVCGFVQTATERYTDEVLNSHGNSHYVILF